MPETGYSLTLPFDADDPQFRRGIEIGILWARVLECEPAPVREMVHADCAEMIVRIAEARGLPFKADPVGDDWLDVTIGRVRDA